MTTSETISQSNWARRALSNPIGIASVSVHGGFHIITASSVSRPASRSRGRSRLPSYGSWPSALSRPAAQYSTKSSIGRMEESDRNREPIQMATPRQPIKIVPCTSNRWPAI